MANKKITDFTELTTLATGDLFEVVDISNTTDDATGSSRKITGGNILALRTDQDIKTTSSPTFVALTLSGLFSGATNIDYTGQASSPTFTLVDGVTITPDFNNGPTQRVVLEGNRTLANPSNLKSGAVYRITLDQGAVGSRTITYGTNYKFPGGTVPTLSTAIGAEDVLVCIYDGVTLKCSVELDFK